MKKTLLLVCLVATAGSIFSQNLLTAKRKSYVTIIYQLTDAEALQLLKSKPDKLSESLYHSPVDVYSPDSGYHKELQPGHYLYVTAQENKLQCELESVNNLAMQILNNHRDLQLVFIDKQGAELKSLQPKVESRQVPFDKNLNVYRIPTTNKQGFISVNHQGHTNFFNIGRQYNNTLGARAKRRILYTFPVKQVLAPFRYVYRSTKSLIQWGRIDPPPVYYKVRDKAVQWFDGLTYEGFMVLNKPKFKPGDTVKMKAYITTTKGRPVSRNLELKLTSWSRGYANKKVADVKPYRPGCYTAEFVLTDSLNLLLDQQYSVTLEGKNYRHDYPSKTFHYEHYDLKQNNFFLRTLETDLTKNNPKVIFLKGTDSNEMPLFDIHVELTAITKSVHTFYDTKLFVPDTLWKHSLKLDPLGETRVTIPDSVFRNASFDIELSAMFRNAENETQVRSVSLKYDAQSPEYESKLEGDSVLFSSAIPGELARLVILDENGDELERRDVTLPYAQKLNQNVGEYRLTKDSRILTSIDLETEQSILEVMAQRTRDSLHIHVQNPHKILFRYQLFRNNRIYKSGSGAVWKIDIATNASDRYYLSLQFVWAGKGQERNFDLQFSQKSLQLNVAHEPLVYPGQTTDINIELKNAFGEPVANADVTAHAWTKKFRAPMTVPLKDYEKFKDRKAFNVFDDKGLREVSVEEQLKYDYWKKTLGLDSSTYYHFLYPAGNQFEYTYYPDNCITQVAPFVVKDGTVQTVHYIYFNNDLQYYNQVNNPEPYSFRAPPHPFTITLRLSDRLVTVRKIKVPDGAKLVLSVDLDSLPANAAAEKREFKFSSDEENSLQPHFLWINRQPGQRFAYFTDGTNYRMLSFNTRGTEMLGPFFSGYVDFKLPERTYTFDLRPNRVYQFNGDLIDRDCMTWPRRSYLQHKPISASFQDEVFTKESITEKFMAFENTRVYESRKPEEYYWQAVSGSGSLSLRFKSVDEHIKAIFFLNLNQPDEYYIYPPTRQSFQNLTEGPYQVVIIYHDETYLKPAPITIQQHGKTFYDLMNDSLHQADAFSRDVLKKLFQWTYQNSYGSLDRDKEMQGVREQFYQQSSSTNYNGHWVSGTVTAAEDDSRVPGVNVVVKGTTNGTVTDVDGNYRVYVPYGGVLVFSFIGYSTQEVESSGNTNVQMQADVAQLSEVVVTGYGVTSEKRSLTAAVSMVSSTLSGRVAGVQINGHTVATDSVMIRVRGAASLGALGSSPLVVVDGVVMSIDELDPAKISRVEILKGEEATALYGARAANGVMLISTKAGISRSELLKTKLPDAPMLIPDVSVGSSLRKRFSDYAFWQPRLKTDENGKVSFKATFPDDITAWQMNVIAVADQKRSVQQSSSVRSFKPLMAQLAMPNFLIEGDSALVIGKITNYSSDTLHLAQRISVNDHVKFESRTIVSNSRIDTINLTAGMDTVAVTYEVKRKGYRDGEMRKIPVFKPGVSEAKGLFVSLLNDTSFTVNLSHVKGEIILHAEADLLDVLLDEIDQLKIYPYDCNEQMASKLYGLLAEKSIREFRKEKFEGTRQVEKAIRRLTNNQNKDGGWGWWEKGKSSLWITRHVAGVLNKAQSNGFKVRYDQTGLTKYLQEDLSSVFPSGSAQEILKSFIFLIEQGEKVNSQSVIDSLRRQKKLASQYDSLLVQRLMQLSQREVDWKWINSKRKQTLRGNWYWGERNYWLWNNDVDNTLLVYRMMETHNPDDPNLLRLRNYFLEQRNLCWRNTYESARIIETLMPALLRGKEYKGKPVLTLGGDIEEKITQFSYQKKLSVGKKFTVSKTGVEPVYFTAYYKEWIAKPEKVEKDFIVHTQWADDQKALESGKQTTLKVSVTVQRDADYVMISVPIPAGSSYTSKPQSWREGEVYREYDVHETRIYCERMKAGTYHYEIPLTARYKGSYTLNPTKAEWMYFPVFFGRNSLSKTIIR
jgi:TonB-dependent SusC/RagA subfamily outer membrane receptor